jgi:hypothetical protein
MSARARPGRGNRAARNNRRQPAKQLTISTDRAAETAEGQRTRSGRKQGATGEFTTSGRSNTGLDAAGARDLFIATHGPPWPSRWGSRSGPSAAMRMTTSAWTSCRSMVWGTHGRCRCRVRPSPEFRTVDFVSGLGGADAETKVTKTGGILNPEQAGD